VAFLPLPRVAQLAIRVVGGMPVPVRPPKVLLRVGPSMSDGRIIQGWRMPAVTGTVSLGLVLWFDP
jgi:hypothetical protein